MTVFLAQPPPQPPADPLTVFADEVRALYDQGGHITRAEVKAALDRLDTAR